MPNLGSVRLTGTGHYLFPAGHFLYLVDYALVAGSPVQFRSPLYPRRVMHGGWLALGYCTGGAYGANGTVLWHKYIEFEHEEYLITPNIPADGIQYHLPLGVSVDVDVFWT